MRSCAALVVACAVFCAGSESSDLNQIRLDIGDTFPTTVNTRMQSENAFSCVLQTPSGESVQFRPDNNGDSEKYQLRNFTLINGCAVDVKITDTSDEGIWTLSFVPNSGGEGNEKQYHVAVNLPVGDTSHLTPIPVNIGDSFPTSVNTSLQRENAFSCYLHTPAGENIQFRPVNIGNPDKYHLRNFSLISGCAVDVKVTDKSDEGVWTLSFSPNSGGEDNENQYKIVVNELEVPDITTTEQTTVSTTTTESTTVPDNSQNRRIEYLNEQSFNTSIGNSHDITIPYFDFVHTESCHIVTPGGDIYNLNDKSIEGLKVIQNRDVACGVEINVDSENKIGKWTLFSRDSRLGAPIERRLNFTIYVEEIVKASPAEVTVNEGNDLYLRLANPTAYNDTCELILPNGDAATTYELDSNHKEECGFIVSNVQMNYTGTWEIVFGERIIYKAPIEVTVNAALEEEQINLEWTMDSPVDQLLGPEDAVFCRLVSPTGRIHFEGFGSCRINLERARKQHNGVWVMEVGTPGKVLTVEQKINVIVNEPARRPRVFTNVQAQKPEVLLTCGLDGQHTVRSCKFREPSGRVLLASQGIGEDRYSFHGVGVRLESSTNTTQCGLRITNPVPEDLGLWRCAMETSDDEVYFGFLQVLCPFVISLPDSPPVVTKPTLTAALSQVTAVESEAVTMDCSVQTEILYCYFRARNGTIFSVSPDSESDVAEYAGAGFDAGECSVRFRSLRQQDSGPWSCHVGFPSLAPEQRATFSVDIQRQITVDQRSRKDGSLEISAQIYDGRAVEYCRFVRIDGLGFDSRSPPAGYTNDKKFGLCRIIIAKPSILDQHPWTVAARIIGQDVEVTGSSDQTLETPADQPQIIVRYVPFANTWILLLLLSLTITLLLLNMAGQKHRQWAYSRAASLRNSFRRRPVPPPVYEEKTPNPA